MEMWVTLWCRREVQRFRLHRLSTPRSGRPRAALAIGRFAPVAAGCGLGAASRPDAPATLGCSGAAPGKWHTVASNGSTIRKHVNAVPRLP
jgi:hypothetical protein